MTETTGAQIWKNADAYEAYMGRWSRTAAGAVLTWLGQSPGLAWLDVGCGTGALTQAILDVADPREILGGDRSADFLTTAAGKITDPRVRFAVGDARSLPTPGDAYDVVIAGLVLHHIPNPEPAALEMARAARPGAAVAAYVWDFSGEGHFMEYLWQAATEIDSAATALDPKHRMPICHPEPLAALFRGADLRDVAVDPVTVPIVFRDFDDYWQPHLLSGSSPAQRYVASLDAEQQTALREQLRSILPIAANGSIPLPGRLWAVRGTK